MKAVRNACGLPLSVDRSISVRVIRFLELRGQKMKVPTGLICAVSFCLLIAGCGGGQSGGAGNPGAAAAVPTGFIAVPGQGMGGVRFGMTEQQVVALLGQPSQVLEENKSLKCLLYGPQGFTVTILTKSGVDGFVCLTGQWNLKWSNGTFAGRTDKGIKIGSTRDEVIAAYGKPDEESGGDTVGLVYWNPGLIFYLVKDRVVQLALRAPRPVRKAPGAAVSTDSAVTDGPGR